MSKLDCRYILANLIPSYDSVDYRWIEVQLSHSGYNFSEWEVHRALRSMITVGVVAETSPDRYRTTRLAPFWAMTEMVNDLNRGDSHTTVLAIFSVTLMIVIVFIVVLSRMDW